MVTHRRAGCYCDFIRKVHSDPVVRQDVLAVQPILELDCMLESGIRRTADTAKRPLFNQLFRVIPQKLESRRIFISRCGLHAEDRSIRGNHEFNHDCSAQPRLSRERWISTRRLQMPNVNDWLLRFLCWRWGEKRVYLVGVARLDAQHRRRFRIVVAPSHRLWCGLQRIRRLRRCRYWADTERRDCKHHIGKSHLANHVTSELSACAA
jgi:hypothetical protein